MIVAIGADHGGYILKKELSDLLEKLNHEVLDIGAHSYDSLDDYPDFAQFLVEEGIDSISVTPDSMLKTIKAIHKIENKK